jgi:hypothetical protein
MPFPSHFSRFYHPNEIWWGVRILGSCAHFVTWLRFKATSY